jgi:hypothetical protein
MKCGVGMRRFDVVLYNGQISRIVSMHPMTVKNRHGLHKVTAEELLPVGRRICTLREPRPWPVLAGWIVKWYDASNSTEKHAAYVKVESSLDDSELARLWKHWGEVLATLTTREICDGKSGDIGDRVIALAREMVAHARE